MELRQSKLRLNQMYGVKMVKTTKILIQDQNLVKFKRMNYVVIRIVTKNQFANLETGSLYIIKHG